MIARLILALLVAGLLVGSCFVHIKTIVAPGHHWFLLTHNSLVIAFLATMAVSFVVVAAVLFVLGALVMLAFGGDS